MIKMNHRLRSSCVSIFRSIQTTVVNNAKASIKAPVIPEPEPLRETPKLQQFCCGLNFKQGHTDPELQSDSNYPEWLWTVHTGRPKTYKDFMPDTREYWNLLMAAKQDHADQIRGNVTFARPCREHEVNFYSRFPQRNHGEMRVNESTGS